MLRARVCVCVCVCVCACVCDNRLSSLSLGYNNNLSKAATVATNYRLDVLSVTNTVKVLNGTEKNCD